MSYDKDYQKKYWQLHKEDKKIYRLKRNFNISKEKYDSLLIKQNFSCAICKRHMSEFCRNLAVDHCHETGRIRGLLCSHCNLALGHFGDTEDSIKKVLFYLQTQNEKP